MLLFNSMEFTATSFLRCNSESAIKRILSASLEAANPADAIRRYFTREKNLLRVNGKEYLLKNFSSVYLVSVGKAAISMAEAASTVLGEYLDAGIVVSKKLDKPLRSLHFQDEANANKLIFLEASHPLPDKHSLEAGKRILELLERATADDLVIFLISGGGSALMTAPEDDISLADMAELTSLLLSCGARIDEINTLRRALDRVKGGGLANVAFPAKTISLLLSDVVNSPLEAIASGPTVPNPTICADALSVLEKYNLLSKTPVAIGMFLQKKEKDVNRFFHGDDEVNTLIVGSNSISAKAAQAQAIREGFNAQVLTTTLQGEAAQVGRELGGILRVNDFVRYGISDVKCPFCFILGGETTVTLGDTTGKGGRNQELALSVIKELAGLENVMLITLATDGEDGPSNAAGAVVTGETFARAQALGLNVDTYLQNHASYSFFEALGDLLIIGSTGTNVNDLTFLFGFSCEPVL